MKGILVNMKKKSKLIKIIYILLTVLIIYEVLYLINYYIDKYTTKKQSNLLDNITIAENLVIDDTQKNTDLEQNNNPINISEEHIDVVQKNERMLKLEELQKQNPDIIGWLEIENTNINYPVLQGTDNSYYMNHNYKKKQTKSGSIFLDKNYSWSIPSDNLLIYGHNMSNGTMFQNLLKYKSKSFYNNHPTIRFTTDTEDAYYDIISVFESKVYNKSDNNVFKYYQFINAQNENEYNNFVANAEKISLYDTGQTAKYGDQLLTLSTCAYHTKNGRFAVVARKRNE